MLRKEELSSIWLMFCIQLRLDALLLNMVQTSFLSGPKEVPSGRGGIIAPFLTGTSAVFIKYFSPNICYVNQPA